MRGWFPSNYVKVVEEVEQILEPDFKRRNTEYRLSLLSNHTPEWIIQKTEDGVDTYYYNTITGEMRIDPPNEEGEQVCHSENSGNRWSDQSTLTSSNTDREVNPEIGFVHQVTNKINIEPIPSCCFN
jgi:hypothetical protein